MGVCFVPGCSHNSIKYKCIFKAFPNDPKRCKKWMKLIRRADLEPTPNSRICSCHFKYQDLTRNPEIFPHNREKFIMSITPKKFKKRGITASIEPALASCSSVEEPTTSTGEPTTGTEEPTTGTEEPTTGTEEPTTDTEEPTTGTEEPTICSEYLEVGCEIELHSLDSLEIKHSSEALLNEIEIDNLKAKLKQAEMKLNSLPKVFSVFNMNESTLRMESGLPSRKIFWILTNYLKRCQNSIQYYLGWSVNVISFEDQILITLMKLRQNYTYLHLANLFHCSSSTIRNIFFTFLDVMHVMLYSLMENMPSRHKNATSLPQSFKDFPNCRTIIDCTDFKIEIPCHMDTQKETYSSYRGLNSFKALIGVAPNGAINYVSSLYPGSISDKEIIENCGFLNCLESGDLVIADKGFLIQSIMPAGVSLNIPPFLYGQFSKSEAEKTKTIARVRIHVERANARIKQFKILHLVPHVLRSHIDQILQVVVCLVNLQDPLIKSVHQNHQI